MYAGVDLVTYHQHDGDQLHPHHQRDQHPDRSVQFVVCSEIGNVKRESIGHRYAEYGCDRRPCGKETPVVVDGRSEIINDRDSDKKNNKDHHKTQDQQKVHRKLIYVKPFKTRKFAGRVAKDQLSYDQQYDGKYEHESHADGKPCGDHPHSATTPVLIGLIAGIESPHQRHHPIGRQIQGKQKTESEQSATRVARDVLDGGRYSRRHAVGQQVVQECDDTCFVDFGNDQREIWNEREQKKDRRENCKDKVERHTIGPVDDLIFLYFTEESARKRVQRNAFITLEAYPPQPVDKQPARIPRKK